MTESVCGLFRHAAGKDLAQCFGSVGDDSAQRRKSAVMLKWV